MKKQESMDKLNPPPKAFRWVVKAQVGKTLAYIFIYIDEYAKRLPCFMFLGFTSLVPKSASKIGF